MIEIIIKTSRSDGHLSALVEDSREYAQIYLLAKQRHKGCDGAGEVMTLREEFTDTIVCAGGRTAFGVRACP